MIQTCSAGISPPATTCKRRIVELLRRGRTTLVAALVTAHLLSILWGGWVYRMLEQHFRNQDREMPGSLSRLDRWVNRWQCLTGTGQNWRLYSPPVWRRSDFPAVRLIFDTGDDELILSDNEPADPTDFCRTGRCRLRRIEDFLVVHHSRKQYPSEEPLWRAYVRAAAVRWRSQHSDNPRRLVRAEFLRRTYRHPDPAEHPRPPRTVEQKVLFEWSLTGWNLPGEPPPCSEGPRPCQAQSGQ